MSRSRRKTLCHAEIDAFLSELQSADNNNEVAESENILSHSQPKANYEGSPDRESMVLIDGPETIDYAESKEEILRSRIRSFMQVYL